MGDARARRAPRPDVNIVHGNDLTDDQLARFCDAGMTFSIAPENEMTQGHGFPITGRLRRLGRAPSLGIDLESVISGEMLTAARITLGMQRALDNADSRARRGTIPATSTITAREALSWVTIEGARMLKMERRDRVADSWEASRPGADRLQRPQHAAGARRGVDRGHADESREHRRRDDRGALAEAIRHAAR